MTTDVVYLGTLTGGKLAFQERAEVFTKSFNEYFPQGHVNQGTDALQGDFLEVEVQPQDEELYLAWLLANAWHKLSLKFNMLAVRPNRGERIQQLINLAYLKFHTIFEPPKSLMN